MYYIQLSLFFNIIHKNIDVFVSSWMNFTLSVTGEIQVWHWRPFTDRNSWFLTRVKFATSGCSFQVESTTMNKWKWRRVKKSKQGTLTVFLWACTSNMPNVRIRISLCRFLTLCSVLLRVTENQGKLTCQVTTYIYIYIYIFALTKNSFSTISALCPLTYFLLRPAHYIKKISN